MDQSLGQLSYGTKIIINCTEQITKAFTKVGLGKGSFSYVQVSAVVLARCSIFNFCPTYSETQNIGRIIKQNII